MKRKAKSSNVFGSRRKKPNDDLYEEVMELIENNEKVDVTTVLKIAARLHSSNPEMERLSLATAAIRVLMDEEHEAISQRNTPPMDTFELDGDRAMTHPVNLTTPSGKSIRIEWSQDDVQNMVEECSLKPMEIKIKIITIHFLEQVKAADEYYAAYTCPKSVHSSTYIPIGIQFIAHVTDFIMDVLRVADNVKPAIAAKNRIFAHVQKVAEDSMNGHRKAVKRCESGTTCKDLAEKLKRAKNNGDVPMDLDDKIEHFKRSGGWDPIEFAKAHFYKIRTGTPQSPLKSTVFQAIQAIENRDNVELVKNVLEDDDNLTVAQCACVLELICSMLEDARTCNPIHVVPKLPISTSDVFRFDSETAKKVQFNYTTPGSFKIEKAEMNELCDQIEKEDIFFTLEQGTQIITRAILSKIKERDEFAYAYTCARIPSTSSKISLERYKESNRFLGRMFIPEVTSFIFSTLHVEELVENAAQKKIKIAEEVKRAADCYLRRMRKNNSSKSSDAVKRLRKHLKNKRNRKDSDLSSTELSQEDADSDVNDVDEIEALLNKARSDQSSPAMCALAEIINQMADEADQILSYPIVSQVNPEFLAKPIDLFTFDFSKQLKLTFDTSNEIISLEEFRKTWARDLCHFDLAQGVRSFIRAVLKEIRLKYKFFSLVKCQRTKSTADCKIENRFINDALKFIMSAFNVEEIVDNIERAKIKITTWILATAKDFCQKNASQLPLPTSLSDEFEPLQSELSYQDDALLSNSVHREFRDAQVQTSEEPHDSQHEAHQVGGSQSRLNNPGKLGGITFEGLPRDEFHNRGHFTLEEGDFASVYLDATRLTVTALFRLLYKRVEQFNTGKANENMVGLFHPLLVCGLEDRQQPSQEVFENSSFFCLQGVSRYLIPIHRGNHFCLCEVGLYQGSLKFAVYDSRGVRSAQTMISLSTANVISQYLFPDVRLGKVEHLLVRIQNGVDCGIHVVLNAEAYLQWAESSNTLYSWWENAKTELTSCRNARLTFWIELMEMFKAQVIAEREMPTPCGRRSLQNRLR